MNGFKSGDRVLRGEWRHRADQRKLRRCLRPGAKIQAKDFGSAEACLRSFPIVKLETQLQRVCSNKPTPVPGSNMQNDSSGLLESLAVGLFCMVALAAIHRSDAPACQAGRIATAPQRTATPVDPRDATMEAGIKDMLLHD
jgi:hypothetical protein